MQTSARFLNPDVGHLAEELARLMKRPEINLGLLVESLVQSLSDGYEPTFVGVYEQAPLGRPDLTMRFPFIIGQTPGQKSRLALGILEGQSRDTGEYATIDGSISPTSVSFIKNYDNPEKNPVPIKYEGSSPDGRTYEGTWRYGFVPGADMANNGTFHMRRVG